MKAIKIASCALLLGPQVLLPCSALAERNTYIVVGASNTSDLVTHEFRYNNRLFFNHVAIERDLNDEIRVGLTYWHYGSTRSPYFVQNEPDPISGLPISFRGTREQRLSDLALTLTNGWNVRNVRPYIGLGLGIFLRSEDVTNSEPDVGWGPSRFSRNNSSIDGARMLFAGADYHLAAGIVVGLSLYYKYNTDTKIEYLDRSAEIKYHF